MLFLLVMIIDASFTGWIFLPQEFDYAEFKREPEYKKQIVKHVLERLAIIIAALMFKGAKL